MRYTDFVTEKPFQPLQLGTYVLFRHLPARRVGADTFLARQGDDETVVEFHLFDKALSKHGGIQKRLHQECKIINSLEHPNVLQILDFGLIKERFYYTTPSKNAMSLRALRDGMGGQLDQEQVLTLATPLASALEYVHGHHVLHRGIDLHSIYVDLDDNVPYLADFSLAKSSDFANLTELGVPRTRKIQVTPEAVFKLSYDERTDIYLFGIVLYSLLTGEDPNTLEAIRARSEEGKPNFRLTPVADTVIGCDRNLSNLIGQLVEPEVDDRIQTGKEVARQFRRLEEKKRVHEIISQMKTDVMASQTGLIVKSLVEKAERKKEERAHKKKARKSRSRVVKLGDKTGIGGTPVTMPTPTAWGHWPFVGLGSALLVVLIISLNWHDAGPKPGIEGPTKPTGPPIPTMSVSIAEFRKVRDEAIRVSFQVKKFETYAKNYNERQGTLSMLVIFCRARNRKLPIDFAAVMSLDDTHKKDPEKAYKVVDKVYLRLHGSLPPKVRKSYEIKFSKQ